MTIAQARRAVSLSFLLLSLAACGDGSPAADSAGAPAAGSATASLDGLRTALQNAVLAKNAAMIADLFTEDGVLILPDGRIVSGRDSIEARIAGFLPSLQAYSTTSQRLRESGELAHDQGTFQVTMSGPAGETQTVAGHQMLVLARDAGGSWKIVQSGLWLAATASHEAMGH